MVGRMVKTEDYKWSCSVYARFAECYNKAKRLAKDINSDIELESHIYQGNGAIGKYCIVCVKVKNTEVEINLNIDSGKHRIDCRETLGILSKKYGNYYTYAELVKIITRILKDNE